MSREALPPPEIPQSIEELTPSWLTAVLRVSGQLRESRVVGHEPELLGEGEGFVGQIVRLRLLYDPPEPSAPQSLIAKLPIRVDQNRQLGEALGAYEREIRFYREMAAEVPIDKPACYHAAMDPNPFAGREKEALDFFDRLPRFLVRILLPMGMWFASRSRRRYVLLLEDLAGRGRLGDQISGCTPDEAGAALQQLARVHAAWWQREALEQAGWVPPVWVLSRYADLMYKQGLSAFFERFGERRSGDFRALAEWFRTNGIALMKSLGESPWTLLHGDYRLDNLFLSGEGQATRVTAFDWQTVARGPGALDVAYFISGNLTRECAADHDMQLLRVYHDALIEEGVAGYDFESCLRDYQRSMLFVAYRMITGLHLLDLTNERGTALVDIWLDRVDPLLPSDPAELLTTH